MRALRGGARGRGCNGCKPVDSDVRYTYMANFHPVAAEPSPPPVGTPSARPRASAPSNPQPRPRASPSPQPHLADAAALVVAVLVEGEQPLGAHEVHHLLRLGEGVLDLDAVVLLHLVEQAVGLGVQAARVQAAEGAGGRGGRGSEFAVSVSMSQVWGIAIHRPGRTKGEGRGPPSRGEARSWCCEACEAVRRCIWGRGARGIAQRGGCNLSRDVWQLRGECGGGGTRVNPTWLPRVPHPGTQVSACVHPAAAWGTRLPFLRPPDALHGFLSFCAYPHTPGRSSSCAHLKTR